MRLVEREKLVFGKKVSTWTRDLHRNQFSFLSWSIIHQGGSNFLNEPLHKEQLNGAKLRLIRGWRISVKAGRERSKLAPKTLLTLVKILLLVKKIRFLTGHSMGG